LNIIFCFFFFQAEDGIRDRNVTGVQTCALPILLFSSPSKVMSLIYEKLGDGTMLGHLSVTLIETIIGFLLGTILGIILATILWRSEERRVGKDDRIV